MDQIQKAINTLELAHMMGQIDNDTIEKARNKSGLYSDTVYNRKKGRANQPYNKRSDMEGHFKGETSTGKKFDVRHEAEHENHKEFTSEEHKEVAEKHRKMVSSVHSEEQKDYHRKQAEEHERMGKEKDNSGIEDKIKKVFPEGFDVGKNINHGGIQIRGERDDNYWININQQKNGEYHIMMGVKGKDVGNAGTSMNTFFNKELSKEELKDFNPENIIKEDKEKVEKIRKEFEEKHGKKEDKNEFVGKTKSGKEYDVRKPASHESYKDFTYEDHKEVANHHSNMVGKTGLEQSAYHANQVTIHNEKAKEKSKKESQFKNIDTSNESKFKEEYAAHLKKVSPDQPDKWYNSQADNAWKVKQGRESKKEGEKTEGQKRLKDFQDKDDKINAMITPEQRKQAREEWNKPENSKKDWHEFLEDYAKKHGKDKKEGSEFDRLKKLYKEDNGKFMNEFMGLKDKNLKDKLNEFVTKDRESAPKEKTIKEMSENEFLSGEWKHGGTRKDVVDRWTRDSLGEIDKKFETKEALVKELKRMAKIRTEYGEEEAGRVLDIVASRIQKNK